VTSFNTRIGAVVLNTADVTSAGGAPSASPNLTGVPTAPTAAQADSSTTLATTAFVHAAVSALGTTVQSFNGRTGAVSLIGNDVSAAGGALLAGPAFTGAPTTPTATAGTSTTQIASTAFVQAAIAAISAGVSSFNTRTGAVTLTLADVTGAGGAPLAAPHFSGVPTAPTPVQTSNDTTLATTAYVQAAVAAGGVSSFNSRTGAVTLQANDVSAVGGALLAAPAFTGIPTAPTPVTGTNTTQLATTAFVIAQLATTGGVTSFNSRAGAVTLNLGDITGAGGSPVLPKYLAGLTLSNDATTPATVLDIAAGSACSDDLSTMMVLTAVMTKNCNAAWAVGSGNGALDSGSALTANNAYAVFIIERPDTSVVDILISANATAPVLPAGYTKKRRIGAFGTDASAHIIAFIQLEDYFWTAQYNVFGQTGGTVAAALAPLPGPLGVSFQPLLEYEVGATSSTMSLLLQSAVNPNINFSVVVSNGYAGVNTVYGATIGPPTNTARQITIGSTLSGTTGTAQLWSQGWIDSRGK
jgi:hypothetical protein